MAVALELAVDLGQLRLQLLQAVPAVLLKRIVRQAAQGVEGKRRCKEQVGTDTDFASRANLTDSTAPKLADTLPQVPLARTFSTSTTGLERKTNAKQCTHAPAQLADALLQVSLAQAQVRQPVVQALQAALLVLRQAGRASQGGGRMGRPRRAAAVCPKAACSRDEFLCVLCGDTSDSTALDAAVRQPRTWMVWSSAWVVLRSLSRSAARSLACGGREGPGFAAVRPDGDGGHLQGSRLLGPRDAGPGANQQQETRTTPGLFAHAAAEHSLQIMEPAGDGGDSQLRQLL